MRDEVVDNHRSTTKFIPECYKTPESCDKVVNRCFLYLIIFLIGIRLKKCVKKCF